jgi:hypothetical protein
MSRQPLFRTRDTFPTALEAIEFFNDERAEGVDEIADEVADFLLAVGNSNPGVLFNVQPGFRTHYIAVARPDDFQVWLYAKPQGVTFQAGDERNVAAILAMWGELEDDAELPSRLMPTDMWFASDELLTDAGEFTVPVEFCLQLSSAWAVRR